MKELTTFFGEIIGKTDLDFLNAGNREVAVQTHNVLTGNQGGIVNGMGVSVSPDLLSILINPGTFYTGGVFNSTNGSGGGELGQLLTQQFFTTLPSTPPIANQPSYLLVYAKIVTSNTDPNPLTSSAVVTSINLQTGESVPTRQYNQAIIAVTNPILMSTALTISGVPLALIQVDYVGLNQVSSNGSVQNVDQSIARNYIVGGTVDINAQSLVDAGVPNNFITNRMYQEQSITGDKFVPNSITSIAIAEWDQSTAYNDPIDGSGVANQHLKGQAVTEDKINYILGLNNLNTRNTVINSSFEIPSGVSSLPANWNITNDVGTNVAIQTFSPGTPAKFGNNMLSMQGGILTGPNTALNLKVSQIVNFGSSIANMPISAFFWAQEESVTSFAVSGTTGMHGLLEFLDNSFNTLQSQQFGLVSGVTATGYVQYTTTSPIIYSGTTPSNSIRLTIGGAFNGTYLVDGAFLATTAIIPRFDINPSEYVTIGNINASQIVGSLTSSQIGNGTIITSKITNADGSISTDTGNGIITSQIRTGAITTSLIANEAITTAQLAPGTGLVPQNALILWDSSNVCPSGFVEATEFAGFFPLGRNTSGVINNAGVDSNILGGSNPATNANIASTTTSNGVITQLTQVTDASAGGSYTLSDGVLINGVTNFNLTAPLPIPFRTVIFCRKT